ncbi:hypothetical protein [Rhodococcus sp. SORGH_AS_0301]|uniref:hypothetical protein n=1 Tax=Rhodococcus sp. SORGH_AS_0301 TaxID=3041780 RepID=UPI00278B5D88|nr:hypothetical protein [Rhodococcus sp. SORGH_AS_0301]MDQ1180380.1 hypothetical protein [Rhodococcus sp. SORGH_AS_0301]
MSSPSSSLAIWCGAWLAGAAPPDDVIDALTEWAPLALVVAADPETAERHDLPWPTPRDVGIAQLLRVVRAAAPVGDREVTVDMVLPAPGDVAGLPTDSAFSAAAVLAGEGVVIGVPGQRGVGLVPTDEGPDVMRWTVFTVTVPVTYQELALGEIEYSMRDTVRSAAEALTAVQTVDTGRSGGDPHTMIAERLAIASRHRYPPLPERTTRVLDTADRVDAILAAAQTSAPSEAPSSSGAEAREAVLRPLRHAVRAARRAAVRAAVDGYLSPDRR